MNKHPDSDRFSVLGDKLERNVYGSIKGEIRLCLLQRDIEDFFADFSSRCLSVLDIGGGGGQFAMICAQKGHRVLFIDRSTRMVDAACKEVDLSYCSK